MIKWRETKVKINIPSGDESALIYILPSGFLGKEIRVYEDGTGLLTVRHIEKE